MMSRLKIKPPHGIKKANEDIPLIARKGASPEANIELRGHVGHIHNEKSKLEKPYILYVGSRLKYKNFDFFINSFSKSQKLMSELRVFLFGGEKILYNEKKLFEKLGYKENQIKQVDGDDIVLSNLYRKAKALVLPSKYEGFGLPLIEAMKLCCPIICSNIKVFKEIANDCAEFFDLESTESLINSMESVIFDSELRNRLIKLGRNKSTDYTWEKCSLETKKIYSQLL